MTDDNTPYQIPNERVALLEYKRILNIGMSNYIIKVSRNLANLSDRVLKHYPETEFHYSRLADIPLFIAIYNSYSHSFEKTRTWILEDDIALHNAAKEIQDLDIDKIHSYDKDRNKIQSLLTYGHIIKQGFKVTNSTFEIYYGTASADPISNLKTNITFGLSKIRSMINGTYRPPTDRISAWENQKNF